MKRMEKIAVAIKTNKLAIGASLATQAALLATTPAFASGAEGGVTDVGSKISAALTSGLNTAITDFVGYVTAILPLGLTVFGAVWGTRKAMNFFRTTAGR